MWAFAAVAEGCGQGKIGGGCGQGDLAVHGDGVGVLGLAGQVSFLIKLEAGHRRCAWRGIAPFHMDTGRS